MELPLLHSSKRRGFQATRFLCAHQTSLILFLFLAVCGCQSPRPRDAQVVSAVTPPMTAADYRVVFPDVLEIQIPNRADSSGQFLVLPDGTVELGSLGKVFVEGHTISELTHELAQLAQVPEGQLSCRVSQVRSRVIQLYGPTGATPVTLPYAGHERVVDVIQRSGIMQASAVSEAIVVRRNTAIGKPEETFRVDLNAIRAGETQTNILLEPNDEIRLPEPRASFFSRTLPNIFQLTSDR